MTDSNSKTSPSSAEKPNYQTTAELFKELLKIIAALRGPDGCPWDKEQSQKSLAQYAIEESFELAEAVESQDQEAIKDELGDFLFQVILQSQVATDHEHFTIQDVIENLNKKMIRRHPHVFADTKAESMGEIWQNWEKTKAQENANKPKPVFSYPKGIPALQAASKIGMKTRNFKFDWNDTGSVLAKVKEELQELEVEMNQVPVATEKLEHELGDLLFASAQLARHLNLDPEQCLRIANKRFENRFNGMLKISGLTALDFSQIADEQKEQLWQQVKVLEAKS